MTAAALLPFAEEGAGEFSDGGILADGAFLIVLAPFLAALLIVLIGKRLPKQGAELAVGAVGFSLAYSIVLLIANWTAEGEGIVTSSSIEIGQIGSFTLEWGTQVDGLAMMMYFVVGMISLMSFVFAVGYMEGDERFTFFFAAFSLFAGSMLLLVSAPNLLQLLVGWELVGLSSYLLIGHWWESKTNSDSAIKAFLVNKVADVGLMIGIIILAVTVGTFSIDAILGAVEAGDSAVADVAVAAAILLFIGAVGKSAQFPLHVWLPDAMAGPTPVSALMHAATMVTAGVYLLARMFPLYEIMAPDAQTVVLVVGTITLVIAALLALVQDDIKKVLAYSTVSQLGYMVAAIGAGAYTAGLFHLFTHAFFKSLLFLGAGSVIHAVHSNNMSDMGGLRKYMPRTFVTFVVGSLALAGIPVFAGFFSKDEILASWRFEGENVVLALGLLTAVLTAFYMARSVFLTFYGEYKGSAHPHESPRIMTVPLGILAVGAAVAGFVNIPGVWTPFTELVGTVLYAPGDHHAESFDWPVLALGVAAGLIGIAAGYALYYKDAPTQQQRDSFRVPVLYPLLENKYYLDDLYQYGVVNPVRYPIARFINWTNGHIFDWVINAAGMATAWVGRLVYGGIDQRGIDLSINAAAAGTGAAGGALRYLQTGRVQQYAAALFVGALALVVGLVIFT